MDYGVYMNSKGLGFRVYRDLWIKGFGERFY